ncbi:anthranilate synthase component I [Haloquadratum walsbyi]|uniref:Anthranilate synthase component 1 n=1 Tax=Haloquadratum walsbyi J07HQW2 TaxID=1238425 RepID=U1PNW6_9EURY|nr:anthranilate synthase component I [Haloquadratum walsbyi]ERG95407.1 MAG: anthranilate synthase component I, archaeal clade [Haloquadratum walsbyi J07HQW2]
MSDSTPLSKSRSAFIAEITNKLESTSEPLIAHVAASLPTVTPLTAYAALVARSDYGFLLESAEKTPSSDPDGAFAPDHVTADRHARFSFVGYDPDAVITISPDEFECTTLGGRAAKYVTTSDTNLDNSDNNTSGDDVLDNLRTAMPTFPRVGFPDDDRHRLRGGLVGFLAYEAVYDIWLNEVGVDRPDTQTPDAEFVLTTKTLSIDHADRSVSLVLTPIIAPDDDLDVIYDELVAEAIDIQETLESAAPPDPDGFLQTNSAAGSQTDYETAVHTAKQRVLDGDIYQGVISRVREQYGDIDPLGLYASLREVNPSPYMYLLRHDDRYIVGASPETLVSVQDDRIVSNPIAGTCSRGNSPVEDRRLAGEMLADGKERAEHTMLVDLARNDVRRVSDPGSVRVEEFMNVLKYSHVQHIESTVTGTLASDADAFDATRATFPAGTLTGAPKIRAMEIVDKLETTPRGVYGGGVGYYSWSGDADFAIVIRTATIEDNETAISNAHQTEIIAETAPATVRVQAGAGIVADSDPASEYRETEQKMDGVLSALEMITTEAAEMAQTQTQTQTTQANGNLSGDRDTDNKMGDDMKSESSHTEEASR